MQRKLISLVLFCLLIAFTVNQVEARPSYHQGFARSAAEAKPEYESLWRGLVGAWIPEFGVTGGMLFDQSAFKSDGTLVNTPIWGIDQNGYDLTFNGSDNYIDTGVSSVLDITGDITILARVMITGGAGDHNPIISKGDTQYGLKDESSFFGFYVYDGSYHSAASDSTLSLNIWHSAAGRLKGTEVALWMDGIKQINVTTGGITTNIYDVHIAHNSEVTTRYTSCRISYIYIFNRALSDAEIMDIHITPLAMFELRPLIFKPPAAPAGGRRIILISQYINQLINQKTMFLHN